MKHLRECEGRQRSAEGGLAKPIKRELDVWARDLFTGVSFYLITCLSRYDIKTCSLKTKVLKATPVVEIQFYVCVRVCDMRNMRCYIGLEAEIFMGWSQFDRSLNT